MVRLIKAKDVSEGEIFCKWLNNRLIRTNKNVLGVELGPTGSGKSYRDLRKAELWYQYHFKKPFPTENICFGAVYIMSRITSGKLKTGEILIFEEAGAELGALDFQNKTVKLFNYVLQSFRSMNLAIFFNLPYMSMLNKQARMLMHYQFHSAGINPETHMNKCKPFFNQVNQGTGKIYPKYLRIKVNGKTTTVKRMNFGMPSQYLIDAYEAKKAKYLSDTTKEYAERMKQMEQEQMMKMDRPDPSRRETEFLKIRRENPDMTQKDIAKIMKVSGARVTEIVKNLKKKGIKEDIT